MSLEIHLYHHFDEGASDVGRVLAEILSVEKRIMATQQEVIAQLKTISDQVVKIGVESKATLAKVDELQAIILNGPPVSPELQAAVDALAAQVKVVDDLVVDAPPAPVTP